MAFFENFSKKVSDASSTAIQKTKDMAEIAKQNSMISDEQKKITAAYEKIGKLYVETFGDSADEIFAEMITAIAASKEKIVECQKKIQAVKGVVLCQSCGAEIPTGSTFCPTCGAKYEAPVEAVVEEAAEVVEEVVAEAAPAEEAPQE